MRWLFYDPNNTREAAQRKKTIALIDRWWAEFEKKKSDISATFTSKKKWDLPGWMADTLQAVHPDLCWEFGPAVKTDGHRLVITPESHRELRPLTTAILKRAPKIKGWEFYPYRLAESEEMAEATVQGRTGGTLKGWTAEIAIGTGNRIDVQFFSPDADGDDDQDAFHTAFVAAETLLGEENLDHWAGVITVARAPKKRAKGHIPVAEIADRFAAVRDSIIDQLPDRPYYRRLDDKTEWTLLKREPDEADDYPLRDDIAVMATCDLPLVAGTTEPTTFHSPRFSRCGETFLYVKLDGSAGLKGCRWSDRSEIEDALNEELIEKKLGCVVGGGTGLRYSYVDLAITKLKEGVEEVRRILHQGRVPKRSWILFYDGDLRGEWEGIFDDTPAPPQPPADDEDDD